MKNIILIILLTITLSSCTTVSKIKEIDGVSFYKIEDLTGVYYVAK